MDQTNAPCKHRTMRRVLIGALVIVPIAACGHVEPVAVPSDAGELDATSVSERDAASSDVVPSPMPDATTDAPDASCDPSQGPGGVECPPCAPAHGAPCTKNGLRCEYGGGPHGLCRNLAWCSDGGFAADAPRLPLQWFVGPLRPCLGPSMNPAYYCPSTFTGLANGAECPTSATDPSPICAYSDGLCGCIPCTGAGPGGKRWKCDPYPTPAGCPVERPRYGSPCPTDGATCKYGVWNGPGTYPTCSPLGSLPFMRCIGGRWDGDADATCFSPECSGL